MFFYSQNPWNLKNPTWHVPIFLDISYPQGPKHVPCGKSSERWCWSGCPVLGSDTWAGNIFPELPQFSPESSAHLPSPVDILQVTCADPQQKPGHYKAATPKYKTMRSVSREVGWQHPGHLEGTETFFSSELFLWSLMTSDFANASRKISAHGEPVILWAPVCKFNSWITGSIIPECFSTNWQSNSQRENTYLYIYIYRKQPSRYVRYLSYKEGHKIPDLSCKFWNSTLANATFYLTAETKINLLDENDGLGIAHLWKTLQPDTRSTFNIFHARIWFFMDVLIHGSLCSCVENKIIITIIFTSEVIRSSHSMECLQTGSQNGLGVRTLKFIQFHPLP